MSAIEAASPESWASVMHAASEESVRAPLWLYPPEARLAVLRERRVRFGVPTADDFDPEYH